jgi:hypothetical protein
MGEASKITEHVLILKRDDSAESVIDDLRKSYPDIEVTVVNPTAGKTIAELVPKGRNDVFRHLMPNILMHRDDQKSSPKPPFSQWDPEGFRIRKMCPSMSALSKDRRQDD